MEFEIFSKRFIPKLYCIYKSFRYRKSKFDQYTRSTRVYSNKKQQTFTTCIKDEKQVKSSTIDFQLPFQVTSY